MAAAERHGIAPMRKANNVSGNREKKIENVNNYG